MCIMRIMVVFLILLIACPANASTSQPEWDENTVFLYGMNVYDHSGSGLPPAPFDEDYLHAGLKVDVINGMPFSDRFLLIFLLNGHLQPYYIDGEKCEYYTHDLGPNGSIELNVQFEDLFIVEMETQFLQTIVIGSLNRLPIDASDPVQGFSNMVTLPFSARSAVNTELSIQNGRTKLSDAVAEKTSGVESLIMPYEKLTQERIFYPPFAQEIQQPDFTYRIIGIGQDQLLQMLAFVDGAPCVGDDLVIPCFYLEQGYAYECSMTVNGLDPGAHQFYAVSCPLIGPVGFSITTPKLRVDVQIK